MEDTVSSEQHVRGIARLLDEHRAENTIILNVSGMSNWTDFFIISTVRSQAHLKGLLERVHGYFKQHALKPLKNRRNASDQGWLLIDCGDFVIHLMDQEMRDFYELEKLWFKSTSVDYSSSSS